MYRIDVVGGLVAVVGITVTHGLAADPGDKAPLTTATVAVAVFIVGLLLLQGMQLLLDRRESGLPDADLWLAEHLAG